MGQLPLMKGKGLGLTVAALAFGLKGICSNMIHLGLAGHVKPGHGQPGGGGGAAEGHLPAESLAPSCCCCLVLKSAVRTASPGARSSRPWQKCVCTAVCESVPCLAARDQGSSAPPPHPWRSRRRCSLGCLRCALQPLSASEDTARQWPGVTPSGDNPTSVPGPAIPAVGTSGSVSCWDLSTLVAMLLSLVYVGTAGVLVARSASVRVCVCVSGEGLGHL